MPPSVAGYYWATALSDYQQRFGERQIVYRTGYNEKFFELFVLGMVDYCSFLSWKDFSQRLDPPTGWEGVDAPDSAGWWWGEDEEGCHEPCFVEFEAGGIRRIRIIGDDEWITPSDYVSWVKATQEDVCSSTTNG